MVSDAMLRAAESGDLGEAERLLDIEESLLERQPSQETSPLIAAAGNNHLAVVRLLCERGADVNGVDCMGRTALYWASLEGQAATALYLLQQGADSVRVYQSRANALMISAFYGCLRVVKALLECGRQDIDARDEFGWTALWRACSNGHDGVAQALLAAGADYEIPDHRMRTPRHIASLNGHQACVDLITCFECIFLLVKARELYDHQPEAATAPARVQAPEPRVLWRVRRKTASACIQQRLERGLVLPRVELIQGVDMTAGEKLEYIIVHMNRDVFYELIEMLWPRCR